MRELSASTVNNFKKIISRKKYIIIMILALGFSVIAAMYSYGGASINIGDLRLTGTMGSYIFLDALNSFIAPLIIFMLSADLLANEISDNTIKAELIRPIDRSKIYFGKILSVICYVLAIYVGHMIISLVFNAFTHSIYDVSGFIVSILVSMLPMFATASLGFIVAVILSNPTITMFVSLVLFAGMNIIGTAFSKYSAPMYVNYLNLYKQFQSMQINFSQVGIALALIISTAVILSTIGQWIFDRKNYG